MPIAEVRLYREGLANNLSCNRNLKVIGTAANRVEALAVVTSLRPDVVVLDMSTRDSLDIVRAISGSAPETRIIAFALQELDHEILACAEAGVAGYVSGEASMDSLVEAIESVMRGELLCAPRTAALLLQRLASLARGLEEAGSPDLSGREQEIVVLIDEGLSNKEIAQQLNIEVATVKNHVHNILEKLHVTSRAEAAAHWREWARRARRSTVFERT